MNLSEYLNPNCALFLDFDGTLVDLAPRPEAVQVDAGLAPLLDALGHWLGGAVAVVSGRPIEQLDQFLAPQRLPVAGVHGVERRRADGSRVDMEAEPPARVEAAARQLAQQHEGLQVELKRGAVALHYRLAPQLEAACVAAMQAAVDESPGLILLHGKMVVEAKPARASKGHAIEDFLREAPFAGRTPVFIGDDVTDEVGFAVVQRLGGVAVKVGEGASVADHRIDTPQALREQLGNLVERAARPVA
ncbi:trehalose-phosphatase [Ramlibacter rhizophilus]|uniref:Trehalose 6-phosphate phosphatase n=1 Tax=Ramlibacter rhizophilus TaxID=1781167 RepID=A0A4Z0BHH1_9BURK|nr:trehalose-phosphatase [Ramlibacter rhizophilus]TFY97839.1 trehalose-phosphatase [Ramlibacter rhizophilus]